MIASSKITSLFIIKSNENQLITQTIIIERDKDEIFNIVMENLKSEFGENHITIIDNNCAISTIRKNIPELFLNFDHCVYLNDSYSKLQPIYQNNFEKIETLSAYFKSRLNAYYLNKEYNNLSKCKETLAFSHHKSGWTQYVFRLNKNFEFISDTNFGFGSVSYFYSIIKYKNVILAPFSKILEYPFAKYKQVINYSAEHKLEYKEWEISFNFICENYYLALENETLFLKNYFYKNLNTINKYLKLLINLDINAIQVINEKYRILEKNQFNSHQLLGSKYCELIKVLETIDKIGIKEYCREYYNMLVEHKKEIILILEKGLKELSNKITFLEMELKKFLKENNQILKDQNKNKSRRYRNEIYFYSSDKLEEFLQDTYKDYQNIENKQSKFKLEKQILEEEIRTSKEALKEIPKYIKFINRSLN